jgi:hypothetical protein
MKAGRALGSWSRSKGIAASSFSIGIKRGNTQEQEDRRIDRLIDAKDQLEAIIAKQRNGPTGTVHLFCDIACNAVRDPEGSI